MEESKEVEEVSGSTFDEKIKEGVVVVDFYAEWCMPCVMMAPVIEEMQEKFEKIKFLKVNVDDNQVLSNKFKVMSIPTLIIFKDGEELERIVGSYPQELLEEKLGKYAK